MSFLHRFLPIYLITIIAEHTQRPIVGSKKSFSWLLGPNPTYYPYYARHPRVLTLWSPSYRLRANYGSIVDLVPPPQNQFISWAPKTWLVL